MAKTIITIGREYSSGGREIGELVAKTLGIAYYDKKLITLAAQKSGLSDEFIANNEQRVFINSLSQPMEATARNWYLEPIFGEDKIRPIGTIACYLLLVAAFGWAIYSTLVVTGIL